MLAFVYPVMLNSPFNVSKTDLASKLQLNETIPGILPDLTGRGKARVG